MDGITFDLPRGSFLTVFGPNGAGKTTLIKILAGLAKPTSGTARVAGYDVLEGDPGMRREIGVISHATCLYDDLSPRENLLFHAKLYGLDSAAERVESAIERVGAQGAHERSGANLFPGNAAEDFHRQSDPSRSVHIAVR